MMRSKWFVLLFAAMATASLWGCGSNGGSGGSSVSSPDAQPTVLGSDTCLSAMCHGNGVPVDPAVWALTAHADDAEAGCEGCHGGGGAHQGVGPLPYPSPTLTQCATCHDISTMHEGDDPATSYQTTPTAPTVEGYVMRDDEPTGCRDCHGDVHEIGSSANALNIEINQAWALSGHAGKIGAATPDTETVWGHYDWDASNRASCQRCHTATGAMNFLNDPTAYVAANNDFSHLEGWTVTNKLSQQNELLNCWGCHSDVVTGDLRNPGAITENYTAATTGGPVVTVSYDDIGPSNVCMGCHLGREVGDNIADDIDADGVRSFINSHYLTAGATLFNESGYEYAAAGDYDSYGYHKNVGVADAQGTGTNGPCVACHMSSAEPHTFEVSAASTVCASCHTGLTDAVLEATADEFAEALEELNVALQSKGIYFYNAHPYFYTAAYVVGGTNTAFTDWASVYGLASWKDVMGAAFNYNLLEHDPGAFAHNNAYSLKLIADSIDFITDGAIDGDDSLAAEMLVQGLNISNEPGVSTIHVTPAGTSPAEAGFAAADTAAAEVVCTACHVGGPHFNEAGLAQYMGADLVCADCHAADDVTENAQILADYAQAGHADVVGTWSHEEDGSCSRCHTSSGFMADLAVPGATYSYPADNRLQVLVCAACHDDLSSGDRSVAAAYTATWSRNSITAVVTFPDADDSNLCIRCHSARRAGANISTTATTTAHYLPAATIVFGGTANMVDITVNTSVGGVPAVGTKFTGGGYEFAGENYGGLGSHKNINTGSDGPCVACHMSGTAGHTWNAVTKDEATGDVTAVNSTVCTGCHGANMTAAHLNTSKAAFELALDELEASLNARSIYMDSEGDFYSDAAMTVAVNYAVSAAIAPAVTQQDMQGAAFNFWLFKYGGADPAAYVHNRTYALNLIADSVDLLNDGLIDGDATVAGSQLP